MSQIRDSPNFEGHVPVFIYPRNRVAQLHPQTLDFLFIASTAGKALVKVKIALRLAVYSQLVLHGVKPLKTHDQRRFSIELLLY